LADSWGTHPATNGFVKAVWFTVPITGAPDAAWSGDWLEGL
jgi:hypothetical protein